VRGPKAALWAAGIVQRRLSNGICVNYCRTDNEPRGATLRVVAAGGRELEAGAAGPSGVGAVGIGARTLSESGTVGAWRREQARAPPPSGACSVLREKGMQESELGTDPPGSGAATAVIARVTGLASGTRVAWT
jgi:hypothetical protein